MRNFKMAMIAVASVAAMGVFAPAYAVDGNCGNGNGSGNACLGGAGGAGGAGGQGGVGGAGGNATGGSVGAINNSSAGGNASVGNVAGGAGGNGYGGTGVGIGVGGNATGGSVKNSGNSSNSNTNTATGGSVGNVGNNSGNSTVHNNNSNLQGQLQGQTQSSNNSNSSNNSSSNNNSANNSANNSSNNSSKNTATNTNSNANSGNNSKNSNTASGNTTNTAVTVQGDNVTYQAAKIPVATAYAAGLTASNGTCMGSTSAGGQGMTFGFSIGSTWKDSDCNRRYNAQALAAVGQAKAAIALLCQDKDIRKAMEDAGTVDQCSAGKAAAQTPAADKVAASEIDRQQAEAVARGESLDPLVRSKLGLPPLASR